MRLRTIWDPTMPMAFRERLRRTRESLNMTIAARLPKRLRYYVTLLELGRATAKSPNIPATPLDEILRNMDGAYTNG